MSTNFFKLPSELRNRELTPGFFRANKTVHREASSLFYTQNRFDFTMAIPKDVASFLGIIGRNNADYIRHVCVNFPNLRDLEPGNITFEESSIGILANIQSGCVNLSTLTTSLYSINAMVLKLDALNYPKIIIEALKLVNTRFRAILSLQEIIVEVYEDGPSDYIRRKMESHGWTVNATEYVEEWGSDRSFGDFEIDWDHDYGYDDDDAYDINNDSDFWRRAGD